MHTRYTAIIHCAGYSMNLAIVSACTVLTIRNAIITLRALLFGIPKTRGTDKGCISEHNSEYKK